MFKLNRMTDYAVVMLSRMAQDEGRSYTAIALAQEVGVPAPTVQKLLKILTRATVVKSTRGAAGGYVLVRPGHEITLAEVITALDGPIALTACVDGGEKDCSVEAICPMSGGWNKVNRAIRHALMGVTLADMIGQAAGYPPLAVKEPAAHQLMPDNNLIN